MNPAKFEQRCAEMRAQAAEKPRAVQGYGFCVCGSCRRCRARKRKRASRGNEVSRDWRNWPELYRWQYFRSIERDLCGPKANVRSSLDPGCRAEILMEDEHKRLMLWSKPSEEALNPRWLYNSQ